MTKTELIRTVALEAGVSNAEAGKVIVALGNIIKGNLACSDDSIDIGIGKFETSERAAHMGRNPQTGEKMMIKASRVVKFKPGKALKDSVNA